MMPNSGFDDSTDTDKTTVLSADQETLNRELKKAKESAACLIIIRGTPQGHRHFLTDQEMIIGRDPNADISITDSSISRKHAKITKGEENTYFVTDLGSSNGTLINGKKAPPNEGVKLAKEDLIKLGNTILKYLPSGELEILFYGTLGSAAHTDALTKIYNKGYLSEALEAEFKRAKTLHNDFTVLFFDIDHFKKINDTYGHDAGDYVLKELVGVVRKGLKPKDIFARYGGEEFVVLFINTKLDAAREIAENFRSSIETHPFIYEGKRIPVTSSFGLAEMSIGVESPQTLLKQADKALYASKQGGRNRVTVA